MSKNTRENRFQRRRKTILKCVSWHNCTVYAVPFALRTLNPNTTVARRFPFNYLHSHYREGYILSICRARDIMMAIVIALFIASTRYYERACSVHIYTRVHMHPKRIRRRHAIRRLPNILSIQTVR